ncbi:MAG: hypothetical protein O2888_05300 [Chloroflexi bacterium]|nr:hypothetical protein [Chloroflexota bacterium]
MSAWRDALEHLREHPEAGLELLAEAAEADPEAAFALALLLLEAEADDEAGQVRGWGNAGFIFPIRR